MSVKYILESLKTSLQTKGKEMRQIPVTRFRREIRKHIRNSESLAVTRCGKVIFVFLSVDAYNTLVKQLKNIS